jgi:hypothetical protein
MVFAMAMSAHNGHERAQNGACPAFNENKRC